MGCIDSCDKINSNMVNICTVYSGEGREFRLRQGYCPIIDRYFDDVAQEAYKARKRAAGKHRIGQQKQRRK
jgi:hypothetical protein